MRRRCGSRLAWPVTKSLAVWFRSTSGAASSGIAPRRLTDVNTAPPRRRRSCRRRSSSPRTGISRCAGRRARDFSRKKRRSARPPTSSRRNTRSSRKASAARAGPQGHKARIRVHLRPFFGKLGLSEVTPGKVQEYRVHRMTVNPDANPPDSKSNRKPKTTPPSRSTLHDEIVTLRLVLKTAIRHGWLAYLPDLSPPYRTQGKIMHRPWFSPEEYIQLYKATRQHARKRGGALPLERGAGSRLRAVHGQHRPSS